jgi:hypothetical protein
MISYTMVGDGDESNIVVFGEGRTRIAHSSHPRFDEIVRGAIAGDESVLDLFDLADSAVKHFDRLSERVTTAHGRLYLDGEEIDNALTAQVLRFLDEGVDDWRPLVAFFDNVQANPSEHSRTQLYSWLAADDFTITQDGLIVGYKGVAKDEGGALVSVNSGRAIVDGEVYKGAIPNHLGAVVEMPRGEVTFDPGVGCSTGLHVGTYAYAEGWAQGALLEVHVNPRDVVSVPTDCDAAKMRTCRYVVVKTIDAKHTAPVAFDFGDEDPDSWGDCE